MQYCLKATKYITLWFLFLRKVSKETLVFHIGSHDISIIKANYLASRHQFSNSREKDIATIILRSKNRKKYPGNCFHNQTKEELDIALCSQTNTKTIRKHKLYYTQNLSHLVYGLKQRNFFANITKKKHAIVLKNLEVL